MGMIYCGVRTNTFKLRTSPAIVWITWIPVAPLPTMPTRLLDKSMSSFGQRAVWTRTPLNASCPGNIDVNGADNIPQQVIRNCASIPSPLSVVIVRRFVVDNTLNRRAELNILAQIELVGGVVEPPFDFRMAGKALAPAPT